MDATLSVGILSAGSAILSSIATGIFTLAATRRAKLRERYVRALEDIASLRALEERYVDELGQHAGETPDAVKRRIWAAHEHAGGRKPSTSAEPARVARKLERLR